MSNDHEKFMAMAIEEARTGLRAGERPFGSVIIRNGEVVGRGHNVTNSTNDPTAHAEVMAIRDASANLKTPLLKGCTLYTSCEPCSMCAGSMLNSAIDTLILAAETADLERLTGSLPGTYTPERLVEMTNGKMEVIRGVLQAEGEKVLAEYDWPKT